MTCYDVQYTGTWYAVAALIGSSMLESGAVRVKFYDGDQWRLSYTGMM